MVKFDHFRRKVGNSDKSPNKMKKIFTADEVLKYHEDANEMHFHQVDREWIIKAMEDFAFEFAEAAIDRWGLTKVERPYLESYYNKIKS